MGEGGRADAALERVADLVLELRDAASDVAQAALLERLAPTADLDRAERVRDELDVLSGTCYAAAYRLESGQDPAAVAAWLRKAADRTKPARSRS